MVHAFALVFPSGLPDYRTGKAVLRNGGLRLERKSREPDGFRPLRKNVRHDERSACADWRAAAGERLFLRVDALPGRAGDEAAKSGGRTDLNQPHPKVAF